MFADSPPARTVDMATLQWRLAIARYLDWYDATAIDALLRAGVPAPDFAREWLLANLKHPRRGRPPKLKHPERIIRAVWYQIIHGAGNSNSQGDNEAHHLVARKYGVSTAAVTKIWKDATPETRERIRAELVDDMANPLLMDAFLGVKKP